MEIYIKKALNCFVLLLNRNIIWATHIKSINQQPKPRSNYLQNWNLAGKIQFTGKAVKSVSY